MGKQKQYLHIKSMSQLQTERIKLDGDIKIKEALFNIHYYRLRDGIRIENLLSSFISKFSIIMPIILSATQTLKKFFNSALSLFKSKIEDIRQPQEECDSNE